MARHRRDDNQEDIVSVPIDSEEEEGRGAEDEVQDTASLLARIDVLEAELEEQRQIAGQEHDRHLRAVADFANYRRRRDEEFKRYVESANQELILKLLPVIDNLERAAQAAEEAQSLDSLVEGVRLTLRQIGDLLEKEGVQPIEAVGQEFDPMKHEAIMRVETDEYSENTILEEVEKGYTLKDRVIRPSRVVVSVND